MTNERVPVPEDVKNRIFRLAKIIHERLDQAEFNGKLGFILFVSPIDKDQTVKPENDWIFYIGTVKDEDAMKLVKHWLASETTKQVGNA